MRLETEAAIRAARIAQEITESREGAGEVTSKGGIDLVTNTDLACEDAIRDELLRTFPQYPVVGEERGGEPFDGHPYWLVDPICGTRPYASKVPLFCTNIALVEDGIVTAASIAIGGSDEILYAEQGKGAWMRTSTEDERISVSAGSDTIWIDSKAEPGADVVRRALLAKRWYVWQFSSSVSLAYFACGRIAGVLSFSGPGPQNNHGSVHSAAGCFVATEAGGLVTDLSTEHPWTLQTTSFLMAATPEVQRDLSRLLL